jgi:hypothetical protein
VQRSAPLKLEVNPTMPGALFSKDQFLILHGDEATRNPTSATL